MNIRIENLKNIGIYTITFINNGMQIELLGRSEKLAVPSRKGSTWFNRLNVVRKSLLQIDL